MDDSCFNFNSSNKESFISNLVTESLYRFTIILVNLLPIFTKFQMTVNLKLGGFYHVHFQKKYVDTEVKQKLLVKID